MLSPGAGLRRLGLSSLTGRSSRRTFRSVWSVLLLLHTIKAERARAATGIAGVHEGGRINATRGAIFCAKLLRDLLPYQELV